MSVDELREAVEARVRYHLHELTNEILDLLDAYIASRIAWVQIPARRAVARDDPAIKWLVKQLKKIREENPRFDFRLDGDGEIITGVKLHAPDEETLREAQRKVNWAFQKALERPNPTLGRRGGERR